MVIPLKCVAVLFGLSPEGKYNTVSNKSLQRVSAMPQSRGVRNSVRVVSDVRFWWFLKKSDIYRHWKTWNPTFRPTLWHRTGGKFLMSKSFPCRPWKVVSGPRALGPWGCSATARTQVQIQVHCTGAVICTRDADRQYLTQKKSFFFKTPQSDGEGHRHTVQLNKPPCTLHSQAVFTIQFTARRRWKRW